MPRTQADREYRDDDGIAAAVAEWDPSPWWHTDPKDYGTIADRPCGACGHDPVKCPCAGNERENRV